MQLAGLAEGGISVGKFLRGGAARSAGVRVALQEGAGAGAAEAGPAIPPRRIPEATVTGESAEGGVEVGDTISHKAAAATTDTSAGTGASAGALRTEVRNGYTYTLDDLNRTTRIEGDLVSNPAQGRSASAQLRAGGADRLATDEGGHFVGRRFNGPLDDFNHFAQDMNLNRGAYKALENSWERALRNGSSVSIDIATGYLENSLRPRSLKINYTINGAPYEESFINRPGG